MPARPLKRRGVHETSYPPLSGTMKPNPFMALYHFTVPISWTLAFKGCRSDGDSKLPRVGLVRAAVLLPTLMTSATWGPRCPGVTRISSVSPGCRVLMPMPASAPTWRKASPVPSESSTKPYLLSGLYHLTLPQNAGAGSSSSCGSVGCGATSASRRELVASSSSTICCRL